MQIFWFMSPCNFEGSSNVFEQIQSDEEGLQGVTTQNAKIWEEQAFITHDLLSTILPTLTFEYEELTCRSCAVEQNAE